jgi:hypothetical protein
MQVANGRLILKCGRRVTRKVTIQTLISCAIRWQKLDWSILVILLLHFHYYQYYHIYSFLLLAGKV